jgi:hypothetical protein
MIELLLVCRSIQNPYPSSVNFILFPLSITSVHFTSRASLALCTTRCHYSNIQTQTQRTTCYSLLLIFLFVFFLPLTKMKAYGARDFRKGRRRGRCESWLWSSGYFLTVGQESYFGNLLERH